MLLYIELFVHLLHVLPPSIIWICLSTLICPRSRVVGVIHMSEVSGSSLGTAPLPMECTLIHLPHDHRGTDAVGALQRVASTLFLKISRLYVKMSKKLKILKLSYID